MREAYPDYTAWETNGKYYDTKSPEDNPRWFMVDWQLVRKTKRQITLEELKGHKEGALKDMALFTTARLSVQPVNKEQWDFVMGLEEVGEAEEKEEGLVKEGGKEKEGEAAGEDAAAATTESGKSEERGGASSKRGSSRRKKQKS